MAVRKVRERQGVFEGMLEPTAPKDGPKVPATLNLPEQTRDLSADIVAEVETLVRERLGGNKPLLEHTLLARDRSLEIAEHLGLSEESKRVVEVAALLHDIKFAECLRSGKVSAHPKYCAEEAEKILNDLNLRDGIVAGVKHCTEEHGMHGNPKTDEAIALRDGDRLAFLEEHPKSTFKQLGYLNEEFMVYALSQQLQTGLAKQRWREMQSKTV